MEYENLLKELQKHKLIVENKIEQELHYNEPTLDSAAKHLFKAGGKRIRPFIMLQVFQHYGKDPQIILPIAASIEILHTFTLIHDDIMDNDALRRGSPSVHVNWGVPMGILAGDVLCAQGFKLIQEIPLPSDIIVRLQGDFASSLIKICEGQAQDIMFENQEKVTKKEYFTMIALKTGELLKLAARIGAICAQTTEEEIELFSDFGFNYGLTFQMIDDILGIEADEANLGKPIGSDIRQGKKTFITLYALKHLPPSKQEKLKEILNLEAPNEAQILQGIQLVKESGAVQIAKEQAKLYSEKALACLEQLNPSDSTRFLGDLINYSLSRTM